ncbi:MAG: ATP-binding protein [Vicinamibacteria bacterium]
MALGAGAPAVLISMIMLWGGDYTPKVQWTLSVLILGFWLGFSFALRERVVLPLQTLSNLLAALREGDYSIRARGASREEALGQVMMEANALGETLRSQRLGALEATTLLRKVMEEIDVAVFTFDEDQHLSLVNRAGERLLARPAERLLKRTASELGLSDCLEGEATQTIQKTFPGKSGRWGLRRSSFREGGLPHQMLVLSDLSQALREEERQVWQRLIRVIGHELNNSLTPIKSMAATLAHLLEREPTPPDWKEDARRVLDVIAERSESLSRFMGAYARLARLPQPFFEPLDVGTWVQRVAALETRLPVKVSPGPDFVIQADASQLEQLLINLIHNAVDASQETGGGVRVGWTTEGGSLEVWVEDDGPGLLNTSNLFVPFFTTKAEGSGIGLVLSRQIGEAHGGNLTLENRESGHGCVATLRLPLAAAIRKTQ